MCLRSLGIYFAISCACLHEPSHLGAKMSMCLSSFLGRAMAQELAERAATEKERELAMSDDFIPSNDDKFHDFQDHLIGKVSGTPEKYNHTASQVTALATAQATWVTAFAAHKKAQIEAHQKAQEKDHARSGLTTLLRSSVHMVNAIPGITNADRAELNLPARAEVRTKAAAPQTRPVLRIVDKGSRRQELHWVDELTPLSRAKPRSADACEIFLKIGDPAPTDEKQCGYAARDTASPYLYEFDVADVGKTAYWLVRWVNRANDCGPVGTMVSAKINP